MKGTPPQKTFWNLKARREFVAFPGIKHYNHKMELKYRYSKKGKTGNTLHYFEVITDTLNYDCDDSPYNRILYFHTYDDLSGFVPNFDITDPKEFITLGTEILINRDYIKNKIVESNRKRREDNKRKVAGSRKNREDKK